MNTDNQPFTRYHERLTVVTVRCVGCSARRDIAEGEIPPDEQPICGHCGSVMVPVVGRFK